MRKTHPELCFCTIITGDYLPFATALFKSLSKYSQVPMYVLIIAEEGLTVTEIPDGMQCINLDELANWDLVPAMREQYAQDHDALRWSLKSVFIKYLLTERDIDKVIFLDPDTYFFSEPQFLFDELEKYDVLLCPHWRASTPAVDKRNFQLNFRDGIFNGGCIGVTKRGVAAMDWWAQACLFRCEISFEEGLFVDQKYLDFMPFLFGNVGWIKHRGCNIASWNRHENRREIISKEVRINGEYEIVFIHFTGSTIRHILEGKDGLLQPYLEMYLQQLEEIAPGYISLNKENRLEINRPASRWGKAARIIKSIKETFTD